MDIAKTISKFSKANRKKVGTVIIDRKGRLVASGYNGTPSGTDNICEVDDITQDYVIHSEVNAILNSVIQDLDDCILYTTYSPCLRCASMIIQKGIKEVIFLEQSPYTEGNDYLIKNGVKLKQLDYG